MAGIRGTGPPTGEPAEKTEGLLLPGVLLLVWLAIVAAMAANHVPWRDEVAPMSLAMSANSIRALFDGLQIDAGHPFLWYAMLDVAHHIYASTVVLKLVSSAVGFLSAAIFLLRAPFPLWFRFLFMFSGLPLFEYSVMARNYGISMLLLFAFAWAYTRKRRNPVLLGLILFLLANTNVLAVGFVGLLLAIAVWDALHRSPGAEVRASGFANTAGVLLAISGILLCVATVVRYSQDSIFRSAVQPHGMEVLPDSLKQAGWELRAVTGTDVIFGRFPAEARPKGRLAANLFADLLLLLAIAGLAGRPHLFCAALAGTWGLSFFFLAIYAGSYRHQGLWLVFVLTLYWLAEARSDTPSWPRITGPLRRLSLYVVLPLLLLINCVRGAQAAATDWRRPASSSRQLAALLNHRDDLKRAVVMSEPDLMIDALPYYLQNRLYLTGLSEYGNVASGNRHQRIRLSLGEILSDAHRLHSETGSPIVILMYPSLDRPHADLHFPYGFGFSWSEAELDQMHRETIRLASLRSASTDENYDVYVMK